MAFGDSHHHTESSSVRAFHDPHPRAHQLNLDRAVHCTDSTWSRKFHEDLGEGPTPRIAPPSEDLGLARKRAAASSTPVSYLMATI